MYVHYGTRELGHVGEFTRHRGDYMVKIEKKTWKQHQTFHP